MASDRISNLGAGSRDVEVVRASTVSAANRQEPAVADAQLATRAQRHAALASQAAVHTGLFFANTLGRFAGQSFLFAVNDKVSMAMFQASGSLPPWLIKTFMEAWALHLVGALEVPKAERQRQYSHRAFYKDAKSILEAAAHICSVLIVQSAFKALLAQNNQDFLKNMQRWQPRLGLAAAVTVLDLAYTLMLIGIIAVGHGKDRAIYKRRPVKPLKDENARAVMRAADPRKWVKYSEYKKNNQVTNRVMVDGAYRLTQALGGEVGFPLAMARAVPGTELAQARFLNIVLGMFLKLTRSRFEDWVTDKMGGYKDRIRELADNAPYAHGETLPLPESTAAEASSHRSADRIQQEETGILLPGASGLPSSVVHRKRPKPVSIYEEAVTSPKPSLAEQPAVQPSSSRQPAEAKVSSTEPAPARKSSAELRVEAAAARGEVITGRVEELLDDYDEAVNTPLPPSR